MVSVINGKKQRLPLRDRSRERWRNQCPARP